MMWHLFNIVCGSTAEHHVFQPVVTLIFLFKKKKLLEKLRFGGVLFLTGLLLECLSGGWGAGCSGAASACGPAPQLALVATGGHLSRQWPPPIGRHPLKEPQEWLGKCQVFEPKITIDMPSEWFSLFGVIGVSHVNCVCVFMCVPGTCTPSLEPAAAEGLGGLTALPSGCRREMEWSTL